MPSCFDSTLNQDCFNDIVSEYTLSTNAIAEYGCRQIDGKFLKFENTVNSAYNKYEDCLQEANNEADELLCQNTYDTYIWAAINVLQFDIDVINVAIEASLARKYNDFLTQAQDCCN
jgi:hypothetical protein